MTSLSIQEAQAQLPELVRKVAEGEEVVLLDEDQPVARLIAAVPAQDRPKRGSAKDLILFMSDDFDAPLDEFKGYMD